MMGDKSYQALDIGLGSEVDSEQEDSRRRQGSCHVHENKGMLSALWLRTSSKARSRRGDNRDLVVEDNRLVRRGLAQLTDLVCSFIYKMMALSYLVQIYTMEQGGGRSILGALLLARLMIEIQAGTCRSWRDVLRYLLLCRYLPPYVITYMH